MPCQSMTGYARADGAEGNLAWTWEAKSVNGRGLEIRCRLPTGFDALEIPAREATSDGSSGVALIWRSHCRRQGAAGAMVVNEARLNRLAEIVQSFQRRHPDLRPASLDGLLGLRGVIEFGRIRRRNDPGGRNGETAAGHSRYDTRCTGRCRVPPKGPAWPMR